MRLESQFQVNKLVYNNRRRSSRKLSHSLKIQCDKKAIARHKMFLAGTRCSSPAQVLPRRHKMFIIGAASGPSPAQDVSRRCSSISLAGTRCPSPAQDAPRRHKMFLIGTRCPSSAQDVPRRHKMFLAGAAAASCLSPAHCFLVGAASGPSPAQDVPHRHKMPLVGTRCSSSVQVVPRRHKMFLIGTRCSSPAQVVPRRRNSRKLSHSLKNRKETSVRLGSRVFLRVSLGMPPK